MKEVLKLIKKCILVMLPLWGFMGVIAFIPLSYISTDTVFAYWNANFTRTKQISHYDVVIIGDSLGATSFMPELLSDSTINLSLSGSSAVEGFYTLAEYLENNDAPTDVFMTYMDYHLEHSDFTLATCNQVHKFSIQDYIDIYKTIEQTGVDDFEEIDMDDYWKDAISCGLFLPNGYISSICNSLKEGGRYSKNKESYDEATRHFGRSCRMTNDIAQEYMLQYNAFTPSDLQTVYITRILDLCDDYDINLHIVKLPLNIYTMYTEDYTIEITGYYDKILECHPNAEFKWYPSDYAVEWFWDYYHMNQHGAYRFSMQLKNDYPELFGDYNATPLQMLAINDDISLENESGELFKWIDQKNYAVFLYDGYGLGDEFNGLYDAFFQYNFQKMEKTDIDRLYVITGNAIPYSSVFQQMSSSNVVNEVTEKINEWSTSTSKIGIIVVDMSNQEVVIAKQIGYDAENFTIEKLPEE